MIFSSAGRSLWLIAEPLGRYLTNGCNSISQSEASLEESDAEIDVADEETQSKAARSDAAPLDESTLFGKPLPRDEDIMLAASVTPDIAVTQIFRWTSSRDEVNRIVIS